MNFIKSTYLSAISTSISIIMRLVVNKFTAVFIGPSGFAIYGQFKDFINLASNLSQFGTHNGVIKYTTETKDNAYNFRSFISTAFQIHLISALVITIGVFSFKSYINNILFESSSDYTLYLVIISFSVIFIALHNLILGILNGLKILKKYILISIISTILTSITTLLAVKYFGLNGLILSLAINHLVVFVISIVFILKNKILKLSIITGRFNKEYLIRLSNFSLMSLSGVISLTLSLLFIRTHIIKALGIDYAGFWDSVWRISAIYLLFLTSSFKFYILPSFTELKEGRQIKKEVFRIWKITLPSILIIAVGIFVLKDFIVRFLFTSDFLLIKSIILFQLLGDIIRIHSWTLGNVLIAKAKTKNFVLLQIIWGVIFTSSSFILIDIYELKGITLAYFFTCIIHFILLNISLKNILWSNKIYG